MPTLILLNPQVYQAPESVIMNQKVHYFHDFSLSYFYRIKAMSWITADHLQWTIYVKTKSRVYMCIKELAQNFPGLLIPHQVNQKVHLSYLYIIHIYSLSFTGQRYPNTTVAAKAYYKCRFFNAHQSVSPPKNIKILIIMKITSFPLKQFG